MFYNIPNLLHVSSSWHCLVFLANLLFLLILLHICSSWHFVSFLFFAIFYFSCKYGTCMLDWIASRIFSGVLHIHSSYSVYNFSCVPWSLVELVYFFIFNGVSTLTLSCFCFRPLSIIGIIKHLAPRQVWVRWTWHNKHGVWRRRGR